MTAGQIGHVPWSPFVTEADLINVHEAAHISLMIDRLVPLIIERKAISFLLQKSRVQCVKARKLFDVIIRAEVLLERLSVCLIVQFKVARGMCFNSYLHLGRMHERINPLWYFLNQNLDFFKYVACFGQRDIYWIKAVKDNLCINI